MKILIIGQAPPAVKQTVPYDTTMLYDMFSWVGISKEKAQELFDFEAISNKFPGFDEKGGHKKPSKEDCDLHWNTTLGAKVQQSKNIIVLGSPARDYFNERIKNFEQPQTTVHYIIHPSKRNYSKIMANKEHITEQLKMAINTQ